MRLIPIDLNASGFARDLLHGDSAAAETVRATLALYQRRGYHPPWIGYLAFEEDRCVGGCGFAAPAEGGEAEIAYFTFPGNEGRGVATQMARELLHLAASLAPDTVCIAHTLPEEGASTRILRKIGFECMGAVVHPEDGTIWRWRQRRS
jgi:[ribosomal protein S5]-alanine N-acetyltransferase